LLPKERLQRITSMRFYYHEHFHVHCQTAGSAQAPEGSRRNCQVENRDEIRVWKAATNW
jgi:hypothetical protein